MRYETMSVQELALEAKGGDREARNTLFLRMQGEIGESIFSAKLFLGRLGGLSGPIENEDIDQQAFFIFCKALDSWQLRRKAFVPYLELEMRWYAVDYVRGSLHLRSLQTRIARFEEQSKTGEDLFLPHLTTTNTADPADLVEGSEQWEALLAQLSDDWRRFVSMKFYEDLSSRQIAEASHRSPRTVNRTLHAALELLRHNLQEEWEAI